MKLFILFFLFAFINVKAETFIELLDSAKHYEKKRDFPTALEWAKKTYEFSQSNFSEKDTNNLEALKKLAALYFYNGKLDSAVFYQEIHLNIASKVLDEFDSRLSESMNNIAVFYRYSGNMTKAEEFYKKSLNLTRKIYKEDHPNLAKAIGNMASFYTSIGKLEEAEPLYFESVKINRSLYKEPHEELAKSINNIGVFYNNQSEYDLAEKYYLESYEIYKKVFDENDDRLVLVLNNLGSFYNAMSKFEEAERYLKKALEIRRDFYKNDHQNLSISLVNLAGLYIELNQYDKSGPLLEESIDMNKRLFSNENDLTATSYRLYSTYLFFIGEYTKAEKYVRKAIKIFETNNKNNSIRIVDGYNTLAFYYDQRSMYKKALINYQKALVFLKSSSIKNHSYNITISNNIGKMYYLLNNKKNAFKYFQKALNACKEKYSSDNISFIHIYTNLANYYIDEGNAVEAEKYLIEAMEMYTRIYDEPNFNKINILIAFGNLYEKSKNFSLAEEYFLMALKELEDYHPDEVQSKYKIKHNLSILYLANGDVKLAEELLLESYNKLSKYFTNNNIELLKLYNSLINLYTVKGNNEAVYKYIIESQKATYDIVNDYFPVLSDYERSQFYHLIKTNYDLFINFTIENNDPEYISTLLNNRLNTKGILLNTSSKIRDKIHDSSDTTLIDLFNKWRDAKEFTAQIYLKSSRELKELNIDIDSLNDYTTNLEKKLSAESDVFANNRIIEEISYKDIQEFLKSDEAAVEIIKVRGMDLEGYNDSIYYAAIIIKKNAVNPTIVILDNGSEMEQEYLIKYREELKTDNNDKKSYMNYWSKISNELMDIDKVYISPDGVYNQINLNTLMNPITNNYLFEELDISILTNISALKKFKKEDIRDNSDFVFFGNPDYNYEFETDKENIYTEYSYNQLLDSSSRGGIDLYPLNYTEDEILSITKLLENKNLTFKTYLDISASEENLKKIKSPRVLHLSTHGYFLKDINKKDDFGDKFEMKYFSDNSLLRSMLFFTGAANKLDDTLSSINDDGILTAFEAQNLDLHNTEIVVLAACETGLGKIINGEGVYGLQRSFIHAGAENIIMSLWKANDKATKELMVNFYKEWLAGNTKQEAFKTAQKIIKEKFRQPYFWGAFIMIGE